MTKKLLLFSATCGILYLTLSSNAGGPAQISNQDYTGRVNPTNTCFQVGCHVSGLGFTNGDIEIRKKDWGPTSTPVTGFVDGETYLVTIAGSNSNYTKFGFQLTAVEGAADGTSPAGTFSNLPASTHQKALSGINFIEHSAALDAPTSQFSVTVEWTAPNPGPSQISFAGIINAVNGNGNAGGDKVSSPLSTTLQNTTSVATISGSISLKAYPNPITGNYLNLDLENVMQGEYNINVYSLNGAHVYHQTMKTGSNNFDVKVNTERWAAGAYVIHIYNGDAQKMLTVVKQ